MASLDCACSGPCPRRPGCRFRELAGRRVRPSPRCRRCSLSPDGDTGTGTARRIGSRLPRLDGRVVSSQPLQYRARDGTIVDAQITLPPVTNAPLPSQCLSTARSAGQGRGFRSVDAVPGRPGLRGLSTLGSWIARAGGPPHACRLRAAQRGSAERLRRWPRLACDPRHCRYACRLLRGPGNGRVSRAGRRCWRRVQGTCRALEEIRASHVGLRETLPNGPRRRFEASGVPIGAGVLLDAELLRRE